MSNTHLVPDSASELQATLGDIQAPCILSTTWPTVPVSSLTLAAFATRGYVLDGGNLIYVHQAAAPVTLSGADGTFWLAVHRNTSTAVASWTRVPGTHYLWRSAPTKPAEPAGGLILSAVTVAGGVVTAVSQATIPTAPLSLQDAGNVLITGGSATVAALTVPFPGPASISQVYIPDSGGTLVLGINANVSDGAGTRYNIYAQGTAPNYFLGSVVGSRILLNEVISTDRRLGITYLRATEHGLVLRPTDDTSPNYAMVFQNASGMFCGGIATTSTTTSYLTASDARLKEAITALAGALDVILALRPVAFRWHSDQSEGYGFLAHELQAVIPEAVLGEPNAVNADGSVRPQQVDHSKLIPWLVGAVQALTARVVTLEAAQQP